jgi:hypothetical protein
MSLSFLSSGTPSCTRVLLQPIPQQLSSSASSFGGLFFTSVEWDDNRSFACLPYHRCGGLVEEGEHQVSLLCQEFVRCVEARYYQVLAALGQ